MKGAVTLAIQANIVLSWFIPFTCVHLIVKGDKMPTESGGSVVFLDWHTTYCSFILSDIVFMLTIQTDRQILSVVDIFS